MVVRIRLARSGPRNHPLLHLVAIQAPKRRDARPLEQLGIFTPHPVLRVKPPSLVELVQSVQLARTRRNSEALKKISNGLAEGGLREVRKDIRWDVNRIKYWLGVGAQPSESVLRLLRAGGIINQPADLVHLRAKTSIPGSKPKTPLRFLVASTRRGLQGTLSRFRRRGLLPLGTRLLPDGRLRIPGIITKSGRNLTLLPSEVRASLSKAASMLIKEPNRILHPRWKPEPLTNQHQGKFQTVTTRQKPDPGWWKVKRRRRAAALALAEQLPSSRLKTSPASAPS
ncbi:hypothetical protein CROQUDRAFT_106491 [Cronartium quercuum f. sp. fusiforme G11]|uniref:Ribosomal protein S16 n=1 Tax=Cronartium quercuum f. sp. fusiforme G11 TaxID=708437 RepID=A0A9P6TE63_9BASI|nr:hypothetical protein CROQUDRAFT_106491 [Cronartium quercuum f. sp. fusiforme G11]